MSWLDIWFELFLILSGPVLLQFADGYLDLIIMRDCPRWALLSLLIKIQSGTHIKSKYVEYLKVLS